MRDPVIGDNAWADAAHVPTNKVVLETHLLSITKPLSLRKIAEGQLALPLVRMEKSQKSAKGVHLQDLADYLDARRAEAQREFRQMYR